MTTTAIIRSVEKRHTPQTCDVSGVATKSRSNFFEDLDEANFTVLLSADTTADDVLSRAETATMKFVNLKEEDDEQSS